jgi:leader peptidase (prepilin peptidase)/N-methyltransferase
VEFVTALLCVGCYLRFGLSPTGVVAFAFVCTMVVITFIDIDYMIIPDVISYPGTIVGCVIGAVNQFFREPSRPLLRDPFVPSILDSILGVLAGAGILVAIWWIYLKVRKREGLGLGDVKLLAMIGTTFGWQAAWFTIFVGSMAGSVIGITLALISKSGLSSYLPFGPYLVIGILLYLFDAPALYQYLTAGDAPVSWWIVFQQYQH